MLEPGDDAPDPELPDQHGDLVSLSDFCGEHVVVYSYPRADTPGYTTEACGFRGSWDEFEDRDAMILGISDDPASDLDSSAEKYDLPFTFLSDEDGSVFAAYDSYGERNMSGKTFGGMFHNFHLVGPDGTVERAYEGVSPDGHADETLTDLDG